jgi:hypothetical protein
MCRIKAGQRVGWVLANVLQQQQQKSICWCLCVLQASQRVGGPGQSPAAATARQNIARLCKQIYHRALCSTLPSRDVGYKTVPTKPRLPTMPVYLDVSDHVPLLVVAGCLAPVQPWQQQQQQQQHVSAHTTRLQSTFQQGMPAAASSADSSACKPFYRRTGRPFWGNSVHPAETRTLLFMLLCNTFQILDAKCLQRSSPMPQ